MSDIVDTVDYKGYTINISQDIEPLNPRVDWDNACKMACFHRSYNLGDEHDINTDDFPKLYDIVDHLEKEEGSILARPLYLYDHSGLSISMSDFGDRWDSGCLGVIYITRKSMEEFLGFKRLTKKNQERVIEVMQGEVETYDQYLKGEVYGFEIEETGDSCWGFFGYDHEQSGLLEHAQNSIDCDIKYKAEEEAKHIAECKKKHFAKMKAWIKNKVPVHYRYALTF